MNYEEMVKTLVLDESENYLIQLNPESKALEMELISLVSQSKYLILLKDRSVYHLRFISDLESSKLLKEVPLIDYILETYKYHFDENVSSRMSGDINRLYLAKGSEILNYV